jgi:hypothetical protein
MPRDILKYGIIGGVIVGVLMAMTIPFAKDISGAWGMAIGYSMMLIALSTVFVAIKRRRDEQGGVIGFWAGFGLGLGISIVAGILYALSWEVLRPLLPGDFIGDYVNGAIAAEKAKGVSAEALATFTAEMRKLQSDYANPLFRLPITFTEIFPVGVLVSLISAALLRNPRFLPARKPAA